VVVAADPQRMEFPFNLTSMSLSGKFGSHRRPDPAARASVGIAPPTPSVRT